MAENNEESTAYLRQRRELFIISAILLFIQIAGIEFQEKTSISGISISIKSPSVILPMLWTLWVYWYVRCFQALNALKRNYVSEAIRARLKSCLSRAFRESAIKETQTIINNPNYILPADAKRYKPSSPSYNNLRIKGTVATYKWQASLLNIENNSIDRNFGDLELNIKGFDFILAYLKAIISICFLDIEFTEYILPFLFGLSPLAYYML